MSFSIIVSLDAIACTDPTFIILVTIEDTHPLLAVAFNCTFIFPATEKLCTGSFNVLVDPSPKSHFHCVIVVILSVCVPKKLMGTFKHPSCAVILTTGAGLTIKVLVTVSDSQPTFVFTTSFTVCDPAVDAISTG